MSLPWNERVTSFQINPESATVADIVRMAEANIRMADWIEGECNCPCCTEYRDCAEDCTYKEDDRAGWEHMISARMARWGE